MQTSHDLFIHNAHIWWLTLGSTGWKRLHFKFWFSLVQFIFCSSSVIRVSTCSAEIVSVTNTVNLLLVVLISVSFSNLTKRCMELLCGFSLCYDEPLLWMQRRSPSSAMCWTITFDSTEETYGETQVKDVLVPWPIKLLHNTYHIKPFRMHSFRPGREHHARRDTRSDYGQGAQRYFCTKLFTQKWTDQQVGAYSAYFAQGQIKPQTAQLAENLLYLHCSLYCIEQSCT